MEFQIKDSEPISEVSAFSRVKKFHEVLPSWISNTIEDNEKIQSIADKSFKHPNGFVKLVIEDNGTERIRLHLWTSEFDSKAPSNPDIHDHRWSFVSIPLFGDFEEIKFRESEDHEITDNSDFKYKYHCYSRGASEWLHLEELNKVALLQFGKTSKFKAEPYFCKAGEIHTLRPLKYPAATIVITYGAEREYARIFKDEYHGDLEMDIHAPNLTTTDVKNYLTYILNNY